MNVEDFVQNLKKDGLSDDDIIGQLMSGIIVLVKDDPKRTDKIFEEAQRLLEYKKSAFLKYKV